jgi:thioredoxin:protein disulfide reductase
MKQRPFIPTHLPHVVVAGIMLTALPAMAQIGLRTGERPSLVSSQVQGQVLPVESAFPLQVLAMADDTLLLQWQITPGHYLYRKSLKIFDAQGTAMALPELPQSQAMHDEFFGDVEVYYGQLALSLPLALFDHLPDTESGELELQVEFQGCAEETYCYPVHLQAFVITLP